MLTYKQAEESLEKLKEYLQEQGWVVAKSFDFKKTGCSWYAYKRLPEGTSNCNCNEREPSLCLYPWLLRISVAADAWCVSSEIELCATATPSPSLSYDDDYNQDWVNLKYYNIKPEDIPKKLPKITLALTQAWEAVWSVEASEAVSKNNRKMFKE